MKNITYKNLLTILKSAPVLTLIGGLMLASCTTYMGGYSETDGVYYDPNRDTLPEGMVMQGTNQVDDYYDYQIVDLQNPYLNTENRNQSWEDGQGSDWGNYTGTETYYNDYGYGYPYGFHSGFGFGMSLGWGYGGYYNPWGFGYGPFGGYYSPYYSYYSPYYSYYNPWYGMYYGGYYNPYGGYYSPYGYGYSYGNGYNSYDAPSFKYKRSGTVNNGFRNSTNGIRANSSQSSGFRNDNVRYNQTRQQPRLYQSQRDHSRYRTAPQINTNQRQNSTPRQSMPRYEQPRYRTNSGDSGYRSNNNSGSFRSGSSSSGSTRSSGGFRR